MIFVTIVGSLAALCSMVGFVPQAWKIIDGRLYLNYSKSVQRMWEKDVAKRIEDAARNWPKLHK